jgi:integral membrane protein (TIGR01906 family)
MKKTVLSIFLVIFIILTTLNLIFFIEISKNKDLKEFYKGENLSDNYSEKEKIHMQEVKDLTNISIVLNLISLIIIISLRKTKIDFKKIGKDLITISILLFIGAIFYSTFHHYFHIIFFNSNNWLLPGDSILIQTYPLNFFRNRFIVFSSFILIIGVFLRSYRLSLKRFF